jgi:hypothetical protein
VDKPPQDRPVHTSPQGLPRPNTPHGEKLSETFGRLLVKLFWVILILGGLYGIVYWLTPEKTQLAQEYKIAEDKVVVEPKPHGCDFDDAPLGNKHCHYEKSVDVERVCPGPDCKVTGVYVSWSKVEE